MNRPSWKSLVFGVVVVIALFVVIDQASAWCGGCGGVYGPFPAYTAWDGCCGDAYVGYWRGYARPYRHLGCCSRWYGGWYAGYGCCYPTYSCGVVTSCCGNSVYGTSTITLQDGTGTLNLQGGTLQPTPAVPTPAKKPVIEAPNAPTATPDMGTPTPADPPAPGTDTTPAIPNLGTPSTSVTPENTGILTVCVPFDAKVTINGMPTKSTGSRRQFVSYDLKEGFSYKYEVKAEVVRDGKIVEDTKSVVLTAGSTNTLPFGQFHTDTVQGLAAIK
jgi:uncharacterized protein (TIGR03000 family)